MIEERLLEEITRSAFACHGVRYGRMRIDLLVNDFVYRAVYDRTVVVFEGNFRRNYIHVRDVTRAFLHGIDNFDTMRGEVKVAFYLMLLTKLELCEKIHSQFPEFVYLDSPIGQDPDKRDYLVSNAKIEATGFKPAYSLENGIKELRKGYRMIRNSMYGNV